MNISKSISPAGFARKAAVIDINGRDIRVCLCGPSAATARKFHAFTLDEATPLDDPVKIGCELASQLSAAGFGKIHTAVMLVPRSQAVLIDMQMPAGTDENELPDMVRFQAEKELPFAVENAAMDFRPAASTGDTEAIAVTLYALQAATADYYRTIAAEAGFTKVSVTLKALALAKCVSVAVDADPDECVAVISLGGGEVEIDFIIGGDLKFSRSATVKADNDQETVKKVLREIKLSIQAFSASNIGIKPSGGLLCSDVALSALLAEAMAEAVDFDCELFCPAVPADAAGCDQSWPAAIGASLELPAPDSGLPDLLDPRKAEDKDAIKKRRQGLVVFAVIVFACLMVYLGYSKVTDLSDEAQSMGDRVKEAQKQSDRVDKLVKRVQALKNWDKSTIDWTGHLANISVLAPPPNELYISGIKTDSKDALVLSVRAINRDVVEKFITSLSAVKNYDVTSPSLSSSRTDPLELGFEYEAEVTITMAKNFQPDLPEQISARPSDDVSKTELPERLNRRGNGRRSR